MTTIVVDPQRLMECAGHVSAAQGDVLTAMDAVAAGLSGSGGMAGNDPAGRDWCAAYDPAASRLLRLTADVADGLGAHVCALNESAAAYHAAETWFGGRSAGPLVPASARDAAAARTIPEAQGGNPFASSDELTQQLVNVIGTVWPNGDTERLRAASAQWGAMAASLDSVRRTSLSKADGALDGLASPAVSAAGDRGRDFGSALAHLSGGAARLGEACRDLAGHIDETHQEVQKEVTALAAEIGVTVLLSALTSVISAGTSAVLGGMAVGGRVALAIARVSSLFQRLAALARPIAEKIGRLKQTLEGLAGRIAGWATGRLPRPLRRVPLDRIATTAQKLTDNPVVSFITGGPGAAIAKVLEKRATTLGTRLGESTARRALVLGWRRDAPGLREALARAGAHAPSDAPAGTPAGARAEGAHAAARPGVEEVARAMDGGRATGADRPLRSALEKPADSAKSSLTTAAKDAMDPDSGSAGATAEETEQEDTAAGQSPAHWSIDLALPGKNPIHVEVPKTISLAHGVELSLDDKKIRSPLGVDVEVAVPGAPGKLIDTGLNIVKAADLGDNWWKKRYDKAGTFQPQTP